MKTLQEYLFEQGSDDESTEEIEIDEVVSYLRSLKEPISFNALTRRFEISDNGMDSFGTRIDKLIEKGSIGRNGEYVFAKKK